MVGSFVYRVLHRIALVDHQLDGVADVDDLHLQPHTSIL